MFTGVNIKNVTKIRQNDVFLDVGQTVVGTVSVPVLEDGEALALGTLLNSPDGGKTWSSLTTPKYEAGTFDLDAEVYHQGHIFKSTVADNDTVPGVGDWEDLGIWDANGILYNDLTESKKTTVFTTGSVKQKYLHQNDAFLEISLFKNKILVK